MIKNTKTKLKNQQGRNLEKR